MRVPLGVTLICSLLTSIIGCKAYSETAETKLLLKLGDIYLLVSECKRREHAAPTALKLKPLAMECLDLHKELEAGRAERVRSLREREDKRALRAEMRQRIQFDLSRTGLIDSILTKCNSLKDRSDADVNGVKEEWGAALVGTVKPTLEKLLPKQASVAFNPWLTSESLTFSKQDADKAKMLKALDESLRKFPED